MKHRYLFMMSLFIVCYSLTSLAQAKYFTLQGQALDQPEPALELVGRLQASGLEAYCLKATLPGKGAIYRVRSGQFPKAVVAQQANEKLRSAQVIKDYLVTGYEGQATRLAASLPESQAASKNLVVETVRMPVVLLWKRRCLLLK